MFQKLFQTSVVELKQVTGQIQKAAQFSTPRGNTFHAKVQVFQSVGIGDEMEFAGGGIVNDGCEGSVPDSGYSRSELLREFSAGHGTLIIERFAVNPNLNAIGPPPMGSAMMWLTKNQTCGDVLI